MKLIARVLLLAAAIVAGFGLVACGPSASPDSTVSAPAGTKAKPKWAFVEVGFRITREGKISDVKVLTSDAPEQAQRQAVALIHNYVPKPKIYNMFARQTIVYERKTGKFMPLPLEVHSSQRPDAG